MMQSIARQKVVLLHGLGGSSHWLWLLERRLLNAGWDVLNWSYPSRCDSIGLHAERFREALLRLEADETIDGVHLVGHSMGNIVARAAMGQNRWSKLRRMVMLAPPNRGSYWADWLGRSCRWIWATLSDLRTSRDSFVNQLPVQLPLEFGVLIGQFDELVPRWSSHLPGEADHLVVPGMHVSVLFQSGVARQVDAFLRTGRFDRQGAPAHNDAVPVAAA